MSSTIRKRHNTRSSTNETESSDSDVEDSATPIDNSIIDLTDNAFQILNTDGVSSESGASPSSPRCVSPVVKDFGVIKSEGLNKPELISFVLFVSCLPILLITAYNIFPIITYAVLTPWFPIIYIIKSYSTKTYSVKSANFFSMSTIMWHRAKEYVSTAYRNI